MLDLRLRIFLFMICFVVFVYLIYVMRSRKVDIKYTLPWIVLDMIMFIIAAYPRLISWGCRIVGIQVTSNAVFFAALVFLLVIVYFMSRTISRLNNEIRELSQRIALDGIENGKE